MEIKHATTSKELPAPLDLWSSACRIPAHAVHGIRRMSATDSGLHRKVDGIDRNGWTAWIGIGGRHQSDSMVDMGRKMHTNASLYLVRYPRVCGMPGNVKRGDAHPL